MARSRRQTTGDASLSAPLGGINTVAPAGALPEDDAIYCYNMVASELGLRSRLGYQEWCTGLAGGVDVTVRSMLAYTGSTESGTKDKLFAVTAAGIWDVSASSAAPTEVLAFPINSGNAGWGVSQVMSTSAGRFLLYTDEENGLCVYTESTDTWAQVTMGSGAGQISGVDPANFASVTVWKNRVWYTEKNSGRAWYLSVNAIYGEATSFDFSARFTAGGTLRGLYNWSTDGGSGLDTLLVAISSAGDVVIYQGTNPAAATAFSLKGTWQVGAVPAGRRIATDLGGDLLILSLVGVVPLSRLAIGDPAIDRTQYATAKISNSFNLLAQTYQGLLGWGLVIHPTDNALMVLIPSAPGQATTQLVMSFATRGWFQYRGLPIMSACVWGGTVYFGTADGRVCRNTGYVDNVLLSDSTSYSAVGWSVLLGYRNLGNMRQKRIHTIRPRLLSQVPTPLVQATAKYNLDVSEPAAPSGTGAGGPGTWDNSTWDTDVWGGDLTPYAPLLGASGMGRDVAIAMRGNAVCRTVLEGVDVLFEQGGLW